MVDFAKVKAEANARAALQRAEVINNPVVPVSNRFTELELIDFIQDDDAYEAGHPNLSDWERGFIKSIRAWVTKFPDKETALSEKQRIVLLKLCTRLDIPLVKNPAQLKSPPAPTLREYAQSRGGKVTVGSFDDMDDDIPF